MPTGDEQTWIPLSDGTRLSVSLYLPSDHPAPCVLEALPYRKDDLTWSYRPEYTALRDEHGYAVARLDLRGTGSSEGVATDEYPAQEQQDLVEVIDWLAGRPWCTGAVGMYGTSYSGFNSLQVACERPAALRAVIAVYATDDRYTDDVHYMGGALRLLDLVDYPTYMVAMNGLPPVPDVYGEGWRAAWRERVERSEPWLLRWLEEQWDGPYWRHGSVRPDYTRIACPTMLVGGWADGYRNNTLRTVQELARAGTPHRLLLGPWSHMSTAASLPGPHLDLLPEMVRWWDRWLRGTENGVDREPAITVFAQRSTRPAPDRSLVDGEWRTEATWPPDGLTEEVRALGEGEVTYAVRPDLGTAAWNSCAGGLPWGQPGDQRHDDADSLTWEWPADGIELLGRPRLDLRVRADEPVAFVSAKLCDVFPDGTSALLGRGLLNLTHRESSLAPEPLPHDRPVDAQVHLETLSWTGAAGHRLRLSVAGADWPNTVAPPRPVTLTVDRSASALHLPVVRTRTPGPAPVLHPLDPPGAPDPADGVTWRVVRDVLTRRTTCETEHAADYDVDLGSVRERYSGSVGVDTRTFAQEARSTAEFEVCWGAATVRSRAEVLLVADEHAFDVTVDLRTEVDGRRFADRRWHRRITRHLG